MKFKNFIKNHIQRISAVILCMILLFTCSITALAFDGEIGGLSKELLDEHVSDAYVFYNPSNLPIYSPFNKNVLYYDFKWPVPSEETVFRDEEYVALTVDDGSGFYYIYYVVPENYTSNSFYDILVSLLDGRADYPDIYYEMFCNNATDNGTTLTMNNSYKTVKLLNDSNLVWGNIGFKESLNGYVYCVQLSKDQTILSSSEIYYGEYNKCYDYLPTSNICQVYYHSSHSISNSNHGNYEPQLVTAKNLNYLVSVSTYSITAYDYFDNDSLDSLVSNYDITFTYTVHYRVSYSNYKFYVPESIRGPNFPEGTDYLFYSPDSEYYYLKEGFLTTERAYLILPCLWDQQSSAYSNYIFVFPEDTTPLIYFKFYRKASGVVFLQIISKVDYELYSAGNLLGTFDSDTVTYHCNYATYINNYTASEVYSYSSGSFSQMQPGTDYNVYPFIQHSKYVSGGGYQHYFLLNGLYGCKTTLSLFPSNSGTLGFYTYISPDIKEEVSNGNTGVPGGSIVPGAGGGNYQPPFDSDSDWQKFWEFTIDYDSMKSDAFNGYELTPYPDLPFKSLDGINLFTIPDDLLDYMVSCIQWYGDNLNSFIDYVGGPVGKMLTMMRMIFENCPDVLKFLFMLFFFFFAAMKIMQFDTGYLLAQTSADVHTGILAENEAIRKRNERMARDSAKKAREQAAFEKQQAREQEALKKQQISERRAHLREQDKTRHRTNLMDNIREKERLVD